MRKEEVEGKIYEQQVEQTWKKGENVVKRRRNLKECSREERRDVANLVIMKEPI